MGMQRFEVQFPAIFIIFGSESKSRSKLATNQVASALGISTTFYWSKVLWERNFFPRVDPLPSGCESEGEVVGKRSFKSAENRAADSLWVGEHRYTRFL